MYSLGIVAFEVAHAPWDTAMERVEHIQALRKAGERARSAAGDLFDGDADGRVRELVLGLVRADPVQRPSAALLALPVAAPAMEEDMEWPPRQPLVGSRPHQPAPNV